MRVGPLLSPHLGVAIHLYFPSSLNRHLLSDIDTNCLFCEIESLAGEAIISTLNIDDMAAIMKTSVPLALCTNVSFPLHWFYGLKDKDRQDLVFSVKLQFKETWYIVLLRCQSNYWDYLFFRIILILFKSNESQLNWTNVTKSKLPLKRLSLFYLLILIRL